MTYVVACEGWTLSHPSALDSLLRRRLEADPEEPFYLPIIRKISSSSSMYHTHIFWERKAKQKVLSAFCLYFHLHCKLDKPMVEK
jgi:hypothetical protein